MNANHLDMVPVPAARARPSGTEIRRLRELRERIKVESFALPRALQHRLLEILEEHRPWQVPASPIPEMTRGELVRAIRWRLGTIPLDGAVAAAAFVDGHHPRRRPAADTRVPRTRAQGTRRGTR